MKRRHLDVAWLLVAALILSTSALQAQEAGLITGTVYDAATGNVIPQVKVTAQGSVTLETVTNLDGSFRIEAPAGVYTVKYNSDNHLSIDIEGLEVISGEIADASTVLSASEEVTEIEVTETIAPTAATAETMIVERKLSEGVTDSISGEEIRASTASDAAGALQKVTGVSIVEDKFVYVRGLGERYSATTLNNALLATTEPERRVVPLDMFPSNLLDSIKVLKTYTPDLPAEFSAGLVQVETIEFPTTRTFEVSYNTGFNSQTTFEPYLHYRGGSNDFWGIDDGTRDIPGVIPTDRPVSRSYFKADELQSLGQTFEPNWDPILADSARPSHSWSVVAGNTFGKLGVVGAFTFSNTPQSIFGEQRNIFNSVDPQGNPIQFTDYTYDSTNIGARMGAIVNIAYQFSPSHKILFKNFLSRDTDKETRVFSGFNGDFRNDVSNQRLRWIERRLYSGQLEGEHLFPALGNSIFLWQLGYSNALRDEPDLREVLFRRDLRTDQFVFTDDSQSAFRMYNSLDDEIFTPQLHWRKPFYFGGVTGSIKVGGTLTLRDRKFFNRRFRYRILRQRTLDLTLPPNELLGADNIRRDGFEIIEETRPTDRYNADRDIHSAYAMADLAFAAKWRVIGGLRLENMEQFLVTFNLFDPRRNRQPTQTNETNYLPALNVVYSATPKSNIRFAYSQTLSRPDFRELALFDFSDVTSGRTLIGNPDLVQASINNYDVRWEHFPGGNQLLAVSFFYKQFDNPIEQTIQPTEGLRTSFDNAKSAQNFGFELEFRRGLSFLHSSLREFAVGSNLTFVDSEIDLSNTQQNVLTSHFRPMQGQSRYVYNVILEWARPKWNSTTRFYANSFSSRISDVGANRLPDIQQDGVTTLDLIYEYEIADEGRWKIRAAAQNLTDARWLWTQGGMVFRDFRRGRTLTIGTSYRFFRQ